MSDRTVLRRLLAGLVPIVLFLAVPPAGVGQEPGAWTIGDGPHAREVRESFTRGYAAIPVSALVAVGVEVVSAGRDVRVRVGGREAVFTPESPFFRAGETIHQLVRPVYLEDGVMYLPVQFLLEQLPLIAGPTLEVDLERRMVARTPGARRDGRQAAAADAPTPPAPAPAPAPRDGPYLVVIDPGHGGRDPGAIGPGGTREKDVVLEVGRRLAELLRGEEDLEVRMTRDRDTLIALADRRRKANQWRDGDRPALFVSIHANAANNRSARGFETYFLSEARSEHARRVAERENAAQRFEDPSNGASNPLDYIRSDLLVNHYLHESSTWASIVQRNLAAVHPGPDRGVRQAGFVVLNGTLMPAVLVELGFITNPSEERALNDPAFQRRLAERLARSIADYFEAETARRGG